ncbi:LysR family transcriptional regulator [Paenibacillus sp. GP183]|uniref:LysR family transcriptional regulator n=1 Tax=Paenibacillus sp. GP183 TaxID=1882751 RepID=UPI00089CF07B|nr:LysR family transcriptional regulator [Paenibacillus sp. GP183]SEB72704.1 DNA-binding transcriptional regulator, LysR family [Paenibacillus sp. GP183]
MNEDHVRTFLVVYRLKNYKKAAEELFIPQPTVSYRILQLENELGKKLLIRGKGEVRLTEEGRAFLPHAMQVVESMELGRKAMVKLKEGMLGKLDIGISNTFCSYLLPDIIHTFIQKYPDTQITVRSNNSFEVIEAIKNKHFELGVTRFTIYDRQIMFRKIITEPLYAIVPKGHPLIDEPSVSMERLLKEPLILFPQGSQLRDTIDMCLNRSGHPYEVKYATNNMELLKSLIINHSGISFFSPSYVLRELESKELIKLPIVNNPFPPRQSYIVYRKNELNSLDEIFIEHLLRHIDLRYANL